VKTLFYLENAVSFGRALVLLSVSSSSRQAMLDESSRRLLNETVTLL
jgi:hypothetical protein